MGGNCLVSMAVVVTVCMVVFSLRPMRRRSDGMLVRLAIVMMTFTECWGE